MRIQVFIERENKRKVVSLSGKTVSSLLDKLGINRESILVVRNKKLVTEDANLKNGDRVKILSVISGG